MLHSFEEQNLLGLRLLLENSANAIEDSLQNFAKLPGFNEQMMLAFGNDIDAHWLKQEWQSHNFIFPDIEIVSNNTINGANGAFSSDTNTIYLSAEFLTANQSNLDVVNSVLLEEYGHYLDNEFNSVDSSGDEGAIFSALVRGEELSDSELQQLRDEDDSAVVIINGVATEIEQAKLTIVSEPIVNTSGESKGETESLLVESFDNEILEWNLAAIAGTFDPELFDSLVSYKGAITRYGNPSQVDLLQGHTFYEINFDASGEEVRTLHPSYETNLDRSSYEGQGSFNINQPLTIKIEPEYPGEEGKPITVKLTGQASIWRDLNANFERNGFNLSPPGNSINFAASIDNEQLFDLSSSSADDEDWAWSLTNDSDSSSTIITTKVGDSFNIDISAQAETIFWINDDLHGDTGLVLTLKSEIVSNQSNQPKVSFAPDSKIIDDTEGSNSTVTLVRTGNLEEELTVDITIPTADEFLTELEQSSNTLLSVVGGFALIQDGIKEAIDITVRSLVDEETFGLFNRQALSSTILKAVEKVLVPIQVAQSAYSQSRADNTADDKDYSISTTSVTFAPNQNTATIDVSFIQDEKREGDQSFYLDLSSSSDPSVNDTALAVIRDDDRTDDVGINFDDSGDIADLTINILAGIITGAISGSVGGVAGSVLGGIATGVSAAVLTEIGEIVKDGIQQRIIDYQRAGITDADDSSVFPTISDAIGADTADTLDIGEVGGFASGGGGNDTINGNVGDDVMNGDAGLDFLSGGEGADSLTGGAGADTLTGGSGSDIFAGSIEELNQDVITDFTEEDIIGIDDILLTSENLTITEGSAIIDIDTDLNGDSDTTITLEGDFSEREFLVETVSLGEFDTSFILLESTEPAIEEIAGETVYRFFNPNAGVHFYTASEVERDVVLDLPNYSFEGESYSTVDPLSGEAEDVYRFFNTNTGVHLYTTDENERDFIIENLADFTFEETAFSAYETEIEGAIPIHRFYEPSIGVHFYTPNETERMFVEDNLSNYTYEGIAYYAFPLDGIV